MKKFILFIFLGVICLQNHKIYAQSNYSELPNPVKVDTEKWKQITDYQIGWGSTDVRYKKEVPSYNLFQTKRLRAWKGERVSGQIVISNPFEISEISIEIADFKHTKKNSSLPKNQISVGFLKYVMTDELNKDKKGACGARKASDFDSTLVADVIDHFSKKHEFQKQETRGAWLKIQVPQNAENGIYKGKILVKKGKKILKKLPLELEVINRALPPANAWKFHLDLWQNPYAVARYFNVTPWSEAHFEHLKTEMKPYADAGGKSITTSIMFEPWGGQTQDPFNSMVTWFKKLDGSWHFDFSVFDKWVEFMQQMGVNKQINCYSMVPWKLSFQYFDQATNQLQRIETKPGEPEYETMWMAMLTAFAKHLKAKGWFEKTYISMDERPMEVMQQTLKIIKKADPNFKVSLAGAWHKELEADLDDYCVALRMKYPEEIKNKRKQQGKVTTYYTSCEEPYPNTFTFSEPAESEWFAWYAAKENLDGYLRWAFNSWTYNPLLDSRFRTWAAGDTYLVYPMGRSSVRFERMVEGIQFYEKIRILRQEFSEKQNSEGLKKIENALQLFDEKTLPNNPASEVTQKAREIINSL